MSEKSLLSLREIAGELQLNYRMIINYKNQLQILLPAKYDGQFNKYPSECTDLFRLVSVLRDEGYTFEMIRAVLSGAGEAPEDNVINEWVMIWKEKLDQSGSIQINPDQSRLAQINPDQSGAEEINPDQSESIQTNLGQSGLVEINPEQSRLIQDEIAAELEEKIESQKVVFQNILEATLSDLTAQVNGALTQYYKAIAELQLEYKDLHSRLAHLEKELGATPAPNPVLIELDLESGRIRDRQNLHFFLTAHNQASYLLS